MPEKIFTYGTLRPSLYPGAIRNFNLTPVGKTATLRGPFKMFNLGHFPGLKKDERFPTTKIVGEVVEVENLNRCDGYEGYRPGGGGLYDRIKVNVRLDGRKSQMIEVWVYVYNGHPHGEEVKSGNWEDVVKTWRK